MNTTLIQYNRLHNSYILSRKNLQHILNIDGYLMISNIHISLLPINNKEQINKYVTPDNSHLYLNKLRLSSKMKPYNIIYLDSIINHDIDKQLMSYDIPQYLKAKEIIIDVDDLKEINNIEKYEKMNNVSVILSANRLSANINLLDKRDTYKTIYLHTNTKFDYDEIPFILSNKTKELVLICDEQTAYQSNQKLNGIDIKHILPPITFTKQYDKVHMFIHQTDVKKNLNETLNDSILIGEDNKSDVNDLFNDILKTLENNMESIIEDKKWIDEHSDNINITSNTVSCKEINKHANVRSTKSMNWIDIIKGLEDITPNIFQIQANMDDKSMIHKYNQYNDYDDKLINVYLIKDEEIISSHIRNPIRDHCSNNKNNFKRFYWNIFNMVDSIRKYEKEIDNK